MVKIFVVNLKASVDRRIIMERQLRELGLPFEIFDAVNGYNISEEEILKNYDETFYRNRPDYYTAGSIGCTLSHFYIYQKMVDEQIETALVLEDDMVLEKALPQVLDKLEGQMRDMEIILLFYLCYHPILLEENSSISLAGKYKLYEMQSTEGLKATGAYMIKLAGAKAMVEKLPPITTLPDDWHQFKQSGIISGVRAVYPVVIDSDFFSTTVRPNEKGGSVLKNILAFCESRKVFPVYQLLRRRRKLAYEKLRNIQVVKH